MFGYEAHRENKSRGPVRTLIAELAPAASAIFNRLLGAAADAGHAVGASVSPYRPPGLHMYIAQRTGGLTYSAGNAGI